MTAFTFLHAADLHLGSPLDGLAQRDAEIARRFAAAGQEALAGLVDQALAAKAAFAVIAGDIYDGAWKDSRIAIAFNTQMGRLTAAGIPVYLIKGNHDADSVIAREMSPPPGVHVFGSAAAETRRLPELRVALHGRSYADRHVDGQFAAQYPSPDPGWFNIGILHTSLDGRPGHAAYAPCSPESLVRLGYDYWALGHVHAHEVVRQDPWIVYPGNLQGRSIRETGPKGAVLVDVEDGRVSGLRRVFTDRARFAIADVALDDAVDEARFELRVRRAMAVVAEDVGHGPLALRVRLSGRTPLCGWLNAGRQLRLEEVQNLASQAHSAIWIEKLVIATQEPDVAAASAPDLGFSGLLDPVCGDPEFLSSAQSIMDEIAGRLPAGFDGFDASLEELVAEARHSVLSRAG